MTDTELRAIAADAIHGLILKPSGLNAPAAIGIPDSAERRNVLPIIFYQICLQVLRIYNTVESR